MPSFKRIVIAGILISIIGWAGLVMVIRIALPALGPSWFFVFFITLAISGPALPLVAFLNLRFPSIPPAEANVIIRQAGWCGIYAGVLAWLQFPPTSKTPSGPRPELRTAPLAGHVVRGKKLARCRPRQLLPTDDMPR